MINQDEDRNTKNNEQEIKLGYADVSLKTTEYYHDNIIDVYAQISNLTARNADVELKVYEDSLDGDIVFQRTIKDVTNADSVVVPFELDRSKMNVTPGKDKLYIVKVTTEDEVCTGDNQYLLLLPTLESEITGVQICDGRANLTYDYEKADTVTTGYLPDVDETLKTGTGICFDYAALTTAMLRSCDIPCKLQIGYAGDIKHAWIDVYIRSKGWVNQAVSFKGDTWTLMDPTFDSNSDDKEAIQDYIGDESNYTVQFTR